MRGAVYSAVLSLRAIPNSLSRLWVWKEKHRLSIVLLIQKKALHFMELELGGVEGTGPFRAEDVPESSLPLITPFPQRHSGSSCPLKQRIAPGPQCCVDQSPCGSQRSHPGPDFSSLNLICCYLFPWDLPILSDSNEGVFLPCLPSIHCYSVIVFCSMPKCGFFLFRTYLRSCEIYKVKL